MGTALRRLATACIDVSDGLVSDLQHILNASGCGATVYVDKLPLSRALTSAVALDQAHRYALTAGDDYELIFTVSEERRGSLETSLASTNVKATCIGQLNGQSGSLVLKCNDEPYAKDGLVGYEHSFDAS